MGNGAAAETCDIVQKRCFEMYTGSLTGNFLIAVPSLDDPNFDHTVILVCKHTKEGAFGLVVNKILLNSITPLLASFGIEEKQFDLPVHYGGPVKPEQGYVLYSPYNEKYGAMKVSETLGVTASKEILFDIAAGKGPSRFLLTLGFSGWTANQLEEELMADSWLVAPLDYDILFKAPITERWRLAAGSIGVDLERYSHRSGYA
jgi:putative transcriptional regulator